MFAVGNYVRIIVNLLSINLGLRMKKTVKQSWDSLAADWKRLQTVHLRELFEADPDRFEGLSFSLDDLTVDFQKSVLTRML
jgi:hypothetical protein